MNQEERIGQRFVDETVLGLDDLIQVMFTISPRITDILLHHPDQLTLEQLVFDFEPILTSLRKCTFLARER